MFKVNNNQLNIINIIFKRNYSILSKRNIENTLKSTTTTTTTTNNNNQLHQHNNNNKPDKQYSNNKPILTIPQLQPQSPKILSSIQFKLDEKEDMNNDQDSIENEKRIISTDDVINNPGALEYFFRLDQEEEIEKHEFNNRKKDKTSMEMAEEYIYRLLIDETKRDAAEDEFLFQQITDLPEWNDYNDNVHRELKRLELEEINNPQVDNDRLTSHYERERIKRVNEIRRIHFIPVRDAIYKRYKELEKELDIVIEKKILVTMRNTGLSRDQLKEHKDFAYLFDENYDTKDELFSDKDELDLILEKINGPSDSIPQIIKSIVQSTKQNFDKEMKLKNQKLYLEASSSSTLNQNQQVEQELLINNKHQHQQQYKQQYINNIYNNNNNNNENIQSQSQQLNQSKLSFNDIINDRSYKSQQNQKQKQHSEEEFDLKSILNNMSKKV